MQYLQIQINRAMYYLWDLRLCCHSDRIKPDILRRYIRKSCSVSIFSGQYSISLEYSLTVKIRSASV